MQEGRLIKIEEFEAIFHANYSKLCLIAVRYVSDLDLAKDLVQEFFMYVWNKREGIYLKSSFEAYACRSVKNICITHLKRQRQHVVYQSDDLPEIAFDPFGLDEDEQLKTKLHSKLILALKSLPEKRRDIFLMSNVEGLTYAEIAERNDISVNTVKTQIKKAYATLRSEMAENILIGFILLSIWANS